jgi:hypothetical protein
VTTEPSLGLLPTNARRSLRRFRSGWLRRL